MSNMVIVRHVYLKYIILMTYTFNHNNNSDKKINDNNIGNNSR